MMPEFVFVPSAFKHGVTEEDILHAYKTLIYDFPLEVHIDKWVFIGFNCVGNPIEIFYNPIGENTIKVFHAMDCQNKTIDQIKR